MELVVKNSEGKDTGRKLALNPSIFGIEPNEHAIYLDVKQYLAQQRQGTHKSKERAEIAGSTKKIKRQKGTGTARAGSIKSPLFKGGGRVFGPQPRDYSFKLNKKVKKLARMSALSMKAKDAGLVILDDAKMESAKTKDFAAMLKALGVDGKKSLMVLAEPNKSIYLSSRNLQGADVVTVSELNTYALMSVKNVIITESAIGKIETLLS